MAYQRIKNYLRTAYRTECQTTLPEAYQMTTEKQTDILPRLPTEMSTVTETLPDAESRDAESAYAKRLSESRSALLSW